MCNVSEVLSKDEVFVKFPAIWISEELGVNIELFSKFPLTFIVPESIDKVPVFFFFF